MKVKDNACLKRILLFTVIFGFFVHGYRFLNMNLTHDSLGFVFPQDITRFMSSIGRFSFHIFYYVFQVYPEPLFFGLISLLMIGLGAFFIARILELNDICGILVSAVMTVSLPFTLFSATFIGSLPVFSFSFFFSILSVYFVEKKGRGNFFFAIILLAFAMGGEDQSIIQFAIALSILVVIKNILEGKNNIFYKMITYSSFLLLSGIVYFALYKLTLSLLKIDPSLAYNSLEHIKIDNLLKNLVNTDFLKEAYLLPLRFFFSKHEQSGGVSYPLPKIFQFASIFIYIFCLIYPIILAIKKKIEKKSLVLFFIIFILYPFAVNSVFFISNGLMHGLMKLSYYFILILGIMFIDNIYKNEVCFSSSFRLKLAPNIDYRYFLFFPFLLVIFVSFLFAKNIYFVKELQFNYVNQTVNRVLVNIENSDGYIPGETRVIFIGQLDRNNNCYSLLYLLPEQAGLREVAANVGVLNGYIHKYLGYKLNIVKHIDSTFLLKKSELSNGALLSDFSKDDIDFIIKSPIFPQKGYVFWVNDILIVKLSD